MLDTFLSLISGWSNIFPQHRSFLRAVSLSLGQYSTLGRKTLSRTITTRGLDQLDWSADYKLFSRSAWSSSSLFEPILNESLKLIENDLIAVAYDDTLIKKTGRKIKGAAWARDPLGPPFNINFVWGMRYLQGSILLPLYKDGQTPARAIPVQFKDLPKFKKPRKSAGQEQWDQYKELTKKYNSSTCFVTQLRYLRNEINLSGYKDKKLLAVVDGSYINKTCLSHGIDNVTIVGRTRKNARLYYKDENPPRPKRGKTRFYHPDSFTPEEIRKNKSIKYKDAKIYYGGDFRKIRHKEIKEVYWKWGTKKKPLRLLVIAPTPYNRGKNGKLLYRQPAYLLTDDFKEEAIVLIQKYFDRWQIEVNFQEEKGLMGLGKQQVWSEKAVHRVPVFVVASYAALLLSSVLHLKDHRKEDLFHLLPKWRQGKSKRPSCLDLITILRKEMVENQETLQSFGIQLSKDSMILGAVA